LDNKGAIAKFINNYALLSFNIGPTLLLWLKERDRQTYDLIVAADQIAAQKRQGHGPAIAQVFNHLIMPLASPEDQLTQVLWGKAHFRQTFGREPQGMWLAETAANLASLAVLAQNGLKLTILAQNQVDAIRPLGSQEPWQKLTSPPDPRQPYRIFWGSGPNDYLDAFVYDGPISRAVAFENLLRDGQVLKARIEEAFGSEVAGRPRLVNLATDGESYGHHFHFGEMALAWLFNAFEASPAANLPEPDHIELTNYSHYLAQVPPTQEARLVENSSWSCCHGVERWRSDCGCHTGGEASWNQKWRTPLREGLNWLRDELKAIFLREAAGLLKDPWATRNAYIDVVLADFAAPARDKFLGTHSLKPEDPLASQKILRLLEAQRMGLYMFTSCAWFFDDLAGLEPVQNLCYAARAIELVQEWAAKDLTEGLLAYLRTAQPNDRRYPTGEDVWRELVITQNLKPGQMTAHLAAAMILEVPEALKEFIYWRLEVSNLEEPPGPAGRLLLGRAVIEDIRLNSPQTSYFVALLSPGQRLEILVTQNPELLPEARNIWEVGGAPAVGAWLAIPRAETRLFEPKDLWPSVRQILLSQQVQGFFTDLKNYAHDSFEDHRELLTLYRRPNSDDWLDSFIFRVMAEADLDKYTKAMAEGEPIDLEGLAQLMKRENANHSANAKVIGQAVEAYLERLLSRLPAEPRPTLMAETLKLAQLMAQTAPKPDFWASQNLWYQLWSDQNFCQTLSPTDLALFFKIGENLGFGLTTF
jgi:hypothetical protein